MTVVYRGMNQVTLDAAYNNTQAVVNFKDVFERFQRRSARLYERASCRLNVHYGEGPRQRFDWVFCGESNAPTFIFIHGGYWQNCSKEDFAFIAEGPLANGFNVVLVEYTLAPQASLTQIVAEIGLVLDYLKADKDGLGTADRAVYLCGHSAGGHLTAVHRAHPLITCALAISALVDLEPISLSWLNVELQLSKREIDIFSPLHHIGKGAPIIVAVGASELPELVRQSDEYATACKAIGEKAEYLSVPGATHFSVLEDLAQVGGVLLNALNSYKNF